jgi:hypothetical protein
MTLKAKSSIKYWQIKCNNISKNIIHHDQVCFIPEMQEWFNIHNSFNLIQNINRSKDKNHMIISKDAEKNPSTKFRFFRNKISGETRNRRKVSQHNKGYI